MTERGKRSSGLRCEAFVLLILVVATIVMPSVSSVLQGTVIQGHSTANQAPNEEPGRMRAQSPLAPTVVWSQYVGDVYYTAAVGDLLGNGKVEVVVGSNDGHAYCLDGANGSKIWNYKTGNVVFCPVVTDLFGNDRKEVIIGSYDTHTYCLDGETGSQLWNASTSAIDSSPAVADVIGIGGKEVITGSYDDKVYCLNCTDGDQLWSYPTGGPIYSSPAVADLWGNGKLEVIVGSNDNNVYCLNGTTGGKIWSYPTHGPVYSSPTVADLFRNGKLEVVVGSNDYSVYCLNGTTGGRIWSYKTNNTISVSFPAVADLFGNGEKEVVVGSNDGSVYCLNGTTGSMIWSYATSDRIASSPGVADLLGDGHEEVVVGSYDNSVYCLNGTTGGKLWSYATGYHVPSSPVFADVLGDGRKEVIISSWDGFEYCISTSPPSGYIGESSFINVQTEFSSGNSPQNQGLWYAWVNAGRSQVVILATSVVQGAGPSMNGIPLPSPVSVVIGEHFNTSKGEVFVANTPTFMEIYDDSNHNGVPDSDFTHHTSEIKYYIIWNASQSFSATPVEKQVDQEGVAHYRWSVMYSGIAGLLQPPFPNVENQYPEVTCWINYVECSYDYYLRGNSFHLKVGFAISPLTDLVELANVGGTYRMVPANLSLEGMSLAVLFSTSIACASPTYNVMVQGQSYNSTTTQNPDLPTDNATIDIGNGAVYDFLYNQNYTLLQDDKNQTYTSKGSACGDISVLSPYVLSNGGPCLFIRWAETAKVLDDLISRLSNSLQVNTILRENSSFFYRVSFPVWSNGTLNYDPTYIENLQAVPINPPGSGGLGNAPIIVVSSVAAIGVIMLLVDIFERKRRANQVP